MDMFRATAKNKLYCVSIFRLDVSYHLHLTWIPIDLHHSQYSHSYLNSKTIATMNQSSHLLNFCVWNCNDEVIKNQWHIRCTYIDVQIVDCYCHRYWLAQKYGSIDFRYRIHLKMANGNGKQQTFRDDDCILLSLSFAHRNWRSIFFFFLLKSLKGNDVSNVSDTKISNANNIIDIDAAFIRRSLFCFFYEHFCIALLDIRLSIH